MTRMTQGNGLVLGNSFEAMVQRSQKGQVFLRKGRGFSLSELKKAGLDVDAAKKMNLMIDPRRHTIYDFNVDKLSKLVIEKSTMLTVSVTKERDVIMDGVGERVESGEVG